MINFLQAGVLTAECICFGYSLFKWKSSEKASLKYLPAILGFIFISDLAGVLFTHLVFTENKIAFNLPYYNITTTLIICFLSLLFLARLPNGTYQTLVKFGLWLLLLLFLINVIWIQPFFHKLHTYSFAYGSVILCMAAIFYILQLVRSERIVELHTDPLFWIGVGVIPFYGINIPYMAMYNFLAVNYQDLLLILRNITNFLSYLMYGCIFIGLVCLKERSSSESSSVAW